MGHEGSSGLRAAAVGVALISALAWPAVGAAQTATGQARVVQAGIVILADTGTLGGTSDARDATLDTGIVPSVLAAEVLHAVTVGWPDQVASEASLANLSLAVGGIGITADFVLARTLAVLNAGTTAGSVIGNLFVNGVPIVVTGSPNQQIAIPGGQVVINEQTVSAAGTTVNAIHATVLGVVDVVVASATAGIR
jgi:hypothetical protein